MQIHTPCRFLLQTDVGACRERQEAVRQLRQKEQEVAAGCGLPLVFTLPHLTLSPAYAAFLDSLAATVGEMGPIFRPPETEVALQVSGGSHQPRHSFQLTQSFFQSLLPAEAQLPAPSFAYDQSLDGFLIIR